MKVVVLTDAFGNKGSIATLVGIEGGDVEGADEDGAVILHYVLKPSFGPVMTQVYRDEFELLNEENGQ